MMNLVKCDFWMSLHDFHRKSTYLVSRTTHRNMQFQSFISESNGFIRSQQVQLRIPAQTSSAFLVSLVSIGGSLILRGLESWLQLLYETEIVVSFCAKMSFLGTFKSPSPPTCNGFQRIQTYAYGKKHISSSLDKPITPLNVLCLDQPKLLV